MITHLLIALQSQCRTRKCRNKMSVKILTDIIFVPCQEWLSQLPLSQAETECTAVQMCVTSKKIKLHFSRKTDTLVYWTNQFIILSAFCIWTRFPFPSLQVNGDDSYLNAVQNTGEPICVLSVLDHIYTCY